MNRIQIVLWAIAMCVVVAGCSKSAVEPIPAEPASPAAAPAPAPAPAEPTAATETEAAPVADVAMPEGLPAIVHIYPEMTVTEATAIDADANRFEIKGETSSTPLQVLNYYMAYFRENGWEEDMIMEHDSGSIVVSFKKDGILQYIDSNEGGPGCYVTITTGNI